MRDGKATEGAKFSDYFDFGEKLAKLPSHRILALFRGEKEKILDLQIEPEDLPPGAAPSGLYENRIAARFAGPGTIATARGTRRRNGTVNESAVVGTAARLGKLPSFTCC